MMITSPVALLISAIVEFIISIPYGLWVQIIYNSVLDACRSSIYRSCDPICDPIYVIIGSNLHAEAYLTPVLPYATAHILASFEG
jgi:hypothetical protein